MRKQFSFILSLVAMLSILVACNNVPDYVIPQEEMAQLLADIHIGESVVDANSREYMSDSLKKQLSNLFSSSMMLHKLNLILLLCGMETTSRNI